jgi:predicted amidohydrolase
MKVAVAQILSINDLNANLQQVRELVASAAKENVELILLPENFAFFGAADFFELGLAEKTKSGPIRKFLSGLARDFGLYIIAGSLPTTAANAQGQTPEKNKVFTRSIVYSPAGDEVSFYDKIHLFDVEVDDSEGNYRESDSFSAGSQAVVVKLLQHQLGLSICYDLRFPELYRELRQLGAEIMCVPAAFTYVTGRAHWQVLLRARAIETQCFILAANQGGQNTSTRSTWGHSCIVSPWGEIIGQLDFGAGLVVAELDFDRLKKIRKDMPIAEHQRLN